jgi:hypothetical protein
MRPLPHPWWPTWRPSFRIVSGARPFRAGAPLPIPTDASASQKPLMRAWKQSPGCGQRSHWDVLARGHGVPYIPFAKTHRLRGKSSWAPPILVKLAPSLPHIRFLPIHINECITAVSSLA